MLQWMGGSRRKVTSSRKSIQNRQKQYFEQRRRQQQVPGLENISDARKQAYDHEESRSLDILSLKNLATVAQQHYCSKSNELDVSQSDSQFSQLSPENVLQKITSRFPENFDESCSKAGSTTPTKISAENGLHDVVTTRGCSSKIDKRKVQALPCEYASDNIKKPSKQEAQNDHFSEVSVLDLLGDDGRNSISDGRPVREAHVAFSVEGLGKIGIATPAHSPRRYDRNFPSPPKAPRWIRSSAKHNSSQHDLKIKTNEMMQDVGEKQDGCPLESLRNTRGIFGDEFSNAKGTEFIFSCKPQDAYENQDQKFNYEEEIFFTGARSWNAAFGILDDDLVTDKYGQDWKYKPTHAESCPPFTSKPKNYNSSDYDFRDTFSPSSRTSFREEKRCNASDPCAEYFRDLTSKNDYNPVSFDRERRHSSNKMSSPDSMFCPPDWSFSGTEDSQDSMSLLSEESCSAAAVRDGRSYNLGSHSVKLKNSKIKHKDQNQKPSRKKYDLGKFSADQTGPAGLEEFLYEQNMGAGNNKNVKNQWNFKTGHFSNNYSTFQEILEPNCVSLCKEKYTSATVASAPSSCHRTFLETDSESLSHRLMSEDDLFDPFPVYEPYHAAKSNHGGYKLKIPMINGPSADLIYESEILKKSSGDNVHQLPATFPWETEDHFPYSSFARDFDKDAQFPSLSKSSGNNVHQLPATFPWETEDHFLYSSFVRDFDKDAHFPSLSKQQKFFEDSEVEYRKPPETPQNKDSAEKNSLSSNGRTACIADGKKNQELKDENQELFDGHETKDPSVETDKEAPRAMEEVLSQLESCMDDKLNPHFDSHAPVPSQVPTKDSVHENSESRNVGGEGGTKGDVSYQVMLESYVLQLLSVQKVLMDASGKDIKEKVRQR